MINNINLQVDLNVTGPTHCCVEVQLLNAAEAMRQISCFLWVHLSENRDAWEMMRKLCSVVGNGCVVLVTSIQIQKNL